MDIFGNNKNEQVDGRNVLTEAGNQNIDLTLTTSQTVFSNPQELVTKSYVDAGSGGGSNPFNQDLNTTDSPQFNNLTLNGTIKISNGSVSNPSYTFTNDNDTGMYSGGDSSNILHFSTGGVQRASINNVGNVVFTNNIRGNEGAESSPAYSFFNNNNTGMYSSNLNNIDFSTAGTRRLNITNSGIRVIPAGIASAPSYSFTVDPNTGMYLSGSEELSFSTSGQARLTLLSGGNIDIRYNRLLNSSSSGFNTMFGTSSLTGLTSGLYNTAYGYQSLQNVSDKNGLTALGYRALQLNTSGINNTAVGYRAGNALTTSNNLTAFGYQACYNTNGFDNLGVGAYSCGVTSGSRNTCIGNFCGDINSTGSDNTMIGYLCRINSASTIERSSGLGSECVLRSSNEICLGDEIYTNKVRSGRDNAVTLGTAGYRFSVVYAATGTINTSDATQKNIEGVSIGLNEIMKLKPVKYKWIDGSRSHYGFLAQDFETLIKNGFLEDSGIFVKTGLLDDGNDINVKNITDETKIKQFNYGIRYNELIAPLVKAVQELNNKVEELTQKVNLLESK